MRLSDGRFFIDCVRKTDFQVGDLFWIYTDYRAHLPSPRNCWKLGVITKIIDDKVTVAVDLDRDADEAWSVSMRCDHIRFLPNGYYFSVNTSGNVEEHVITPERKTYSDEINEGLYDLMRGFESWQELGPQFWRSPRELHTDDEKEAVFALSRDVDRAEKVDYFVSHSWLDCGVTKNNLLLAFARWFRSSRGRYPLVWLDKTCINPRYISLCLKLLPVFIKRCDKMVVVAGPTYLSR